MTYESITYEADERVAIITFNRPERLNAFSVKLCADFKNALAKADEDQGIRAVVVTGAGGKSFSVGYDIKESAGQPKRDLTGWRERLASDYDFTNSVRECSKPVIAMINGYCLGGGLEFAQMCDIRYCSDDSKFGVVETRFSTGIGTLAMPWVLGVRCRELIYTGDTIGADEALRLGLVSRVFAKNELRTQTLKIAKRMSCVALACLKCNKQVLNNTEDIMGFQTAMRYGLEVCTFLDAAGTPEYQEFDQIRRSAGLGEALKWRDEQFKEYE